MTLKQALWQHPDRISGAVCFRNTRVPVSIFFEYLRAGKLNEFYSGYPGVSQEQVETVIAASEELIDDQFGQKKSA